MTRSLQLLGFLEDEDNLPTKLGQNLGPFKSIVRIFNEVKAGWRPSGEEAVAVIRSMQRQYQCIAMKAWEMLFRDDKYTKWKNAVAMLFDRTPTMLDMEMLCCESAKIEKGLKVQHERRGKPTKNYFNVQMEWEAVWVEKTRTDHGRRFLSCVPLSVLDTTGEGVVLVLADLSPVPLSQEKKRAREGGGSGSASSSSVSDSKKRKKSGTE